MRKFTNSTWSSLFVLFLFATNIAWSQTTITAGTITSNTTWTKAASPYIITNNLMVVSGVTLTLEPGAVLKFNQNIGLIVGGELIANGTSSDSIYFLANNINQNWGGITFSAGSNASVISSQYNYQSGSVFNYCAVRNVTSTNGAIYTVNTALFIDHSTINQNNANGIRFAYSGMFINLDKVVITNSKISNNNFHGIQFDAYQLGGYLRIVDNTISNNASNGIKTDDAGSHVTNTYYFAGNSVTGNTQTGIESSSNGVQTIENNLIYGNGIGIKTRGTGPMNSPTFVIQKNRIIGNTDFGLMPRYATHTIQNNLIAANGKAVHLNENGTYTINNNNFTGNTSFIDIPASSSNDAPVDIKYNLVSRHLSYSSNLINVSSVNSGQPDFKINNNKIDYNFNPYLVYNNRSVTNNSINATNTYWGTTVESSIKEKIYDYDDNSQKSLVNITPVLSSINNTVALFPVRNVKKAVVGSDVVLTWTANTETDVAGYKIYYGGYTGYSYTNAITVNSASTTTYTLPSGVAISENIAITAFDGNTTGTDDQINGYESWYATANTTPLAPSALAADSSARRVKLTWTASTSTGVNAYYVYRSIDNSSFSYAGKSTTTSFVDSNLTAHTRYYYKVTAFDSLDLSYDNFGLESVATSTVTATPNRIVYVSNTGSNSNIGSFANPVLSIANAIDIKASQGDSIILHPGTYYEAIDLKGKIALLSSRFISSQDTNHISSTILNGNQILNTTLIQNTGSSFPASINIYALTIDSSRLKIADLTCGNYNFAFKITRCIIRNSGQYAVQFGVITLGAGGVLDSCRIYGLRGRYIISEGSGGGLNSLRPTISNNVMYDNSNSSSPSAWGNEDNALIFIGGNGRARVINNLIFRNKTSGVHLGLNGSDSMIFVNNTIVLNEGYGIRYFTNSSPYTGVLINNIVKYNKQLDISCNNSINGPSVYLKNNFFGQYGLLNETGLNSGNNQLLDTTGNKGGNPYFIDTLNNDFRLLAWSPAIASGIVNDYLLSKDIAGNQRINPARSVPDMGAYESTFKFRSPLLLKTEPGNKRVEIFWDQNPLTGVVSFNIYRSTSPIGDNSTASALAQISIPSTTSYVDSLPALDNGTVYYYRMRSIDATSTLSGFSNQLTAKPDSVPAPTQIQIHNSPKSATISWSGVGNKYQLFRGTNLISKTLLADSIDGFTFTDTTLSRNTTYYYWVKAMNQTGALSIFSSPGTLIPTNIWHVDSTIGSNTTGIGSPLAPYKTVSKAVSNTINQDSIYIGDGTYLDNISFTGKKLTIIGINGANRVIIKPLLQTNIIYMMNGGTSYFKGITFAEASSTTAGSVYNGFGSSNPTFESCIIRNCGASGGVFHPNGSSLNMYNCIVYNNTPNTFFEGMTGGARIYHCTFVNNSNHFFNTGINNLIPEFRNCIIWRSTNIVYSGSLSVENCIIKGGFPGTTTNLDVSPSFVDSVRYDYRLKNSSMAIGVGATGLGIAKDFNDSMRVNPVGSLPDLGAFETPYKVIAPIFSKTEPGHKKAKLFWTQTPTTNIVGYKVYRSTSSITDTATLSPIATLSGAGSITYVDSSTALQNGTLYYYRIKSFFADSILSGFSNQLSSIPDSVNIPTNFILDNSPKAVRLTWDSIPGVNVKYQIFRGLNSTSPILLKDSVISRNYVDSSISRNTSYYYWIRGMNSTGALSEYSSFIQMIPTNKWYVDSASGVDINYRGSSNSPLLKISKAISLSIANDTIIVRVGTYTDNLTLTKKLTILSDQGPFQTVIKPLLPTSKIVQFANGSLDSKLEGFKLTNGGNTRGSAISCTFSNPIISRCIITNSLGEAPISFYYSGAKLSNCLIYKNNAGAVFYYDPNDRTPTIAHSTIVYNTGIGTGSSSAVDAPVFRNCIIYGNTGGSYGGNINIENSVVQGGYPGNTTNIDANPNFIDTVSNNYSVQNYSPAIGLGAPLTDVTTDINGTVRPQPIASNPDAGSFEVTYDHPSPYINSDSSRNGYVLLKWIQNPLTTVNKFKIYKGTSINPSSSYDSTAVQYQYTDSANTVYNTVLFYRMTSFGTGLNESGFSNQIRTISFTPPSLLFPLDSTIGADTTITLRWSRINYALNYKVQLSTDSTFTSNVQLFSVSDTFYTRTGLPGNTMYYWRVQTWDSTHYSKWSNKKRFETFVLPPRLLRVNPGNKIDTLTWTNPNSTNIAFFKIYRSLDSTNRVILDTIPGTELTYIDTIGLRLDSTYYYWVTAVNLVGTESAFSNRLSGRPYNKKPITVTLANKNFNSVGEFNFVRCVYSMVGSQDPDGQIVNHLWYVNDSLVSVGDTTLIYYYGRGTNTLKLITIDNDGASDTSIATIVLKTFTRQFNGGILGGISAVSPNIIYTADSTYSPITGASVFKLDRLGNTTYPLIVSSKIFTTPSVSSDSSVFITSGSSLNGFNKAGVSLWPTIPLGGLSYVTPTVDSMYKRIYVGVSNSNFLAVNYLTGTVVWSIFCDAPINVSAVITGDRKLVFVSQSGRLYGFRIVSDSAQTAPRWNQSLGEIISKSPAVDLNNDLYFGTQSGKLIKVRLLADGTVQNLWSVSLGASVESSPVIDARGYVYVGANDGKLYKINPTTGQILWSRQATGAIKSTPAVTDYGNIVFATMNGSIMAVDSVNNLKWTHKENDPISANLLYIDNIIYAGSQSGAFVGLYDNPSTNTVNPSLSLNMPLRIARERKNSMCNLDGIPIKLVDAFDYLGNSPVVAPAGDPEQPVWGTFQGNFRRTGSRTLDCPDRPTINRTGTEAICSGDSARLTTTSLNNSRWVFNSANLSVTDTVFYAKQPGTYMRMNSNDNGCRTYSDSFVLVVNPLPIEPTVAINGAQSFCEGNSSQLSSSATNNSWYNVGSNSLLSAAQSFTVSQSGQYYARTLNTFGCGNNSDTISINVFPRPAEPVVTATQLSFCVGDSATLRSTTVLPRQWLNSGTAISNASASSYTVRTAGFYSLRVTDANGCTNTSQNFQIVANSLPTIAVNTIPANGAVCVGNNMTLTASGASTYSWSGGVVNGVAFTPTQSGNYVVTATDANGCIGTAVRSVIVNQVPNIIINSTPASATVCAGNSIILSATGASSYSWSGNISNGVAFTPTQSGNYIVTGTDINGCVNTAVRSVVVNALPALTVSTIPSNSRVCLGSPILMTASGASTYSWSGGVTNGVSFIPSQSSSYTVTGTDVNGCVNTTTQSIVVNSLPTISIASAPVNSTVCSGSPITLTASGASTYSWSGGVLNGTAFNPTQSSTYVVTGTDANGCSNQAQQTVNVNSLPTITIVSDPINGTICAGTPITLLASGANSYSWTGGVINGVAFTPSQTTTYSVIGTDNNGCRNSATNTVTVLALPIAQITTPTNSFICEGSSTTLNATGNGVTYQWYLNSSEIAGQNSSSINATAQGSYTVITRNLQGCRSLPSAAVVLELHRSPQVAFSYDTYCVGVPMQFTNLSTTTYSGPVQWEWDFGTGALSALSAPTYTYSAAGPYIVKLKVTPTRCPSLARSDIRGITIDKPLPGMRYPAVKALISTPTNLSARLIGGSSYQWTPGTSLSSSIIANPVFNSTNPQDYLINIRASSGCITTDTLSVLVFKESGIYVPKAFSPNGDGQNERLYPELVNFASLQYFRIYNRWGQLVYETRAMSTQGWDGLYNGVKQPMDTYTWFAAGTDKNGKIITANGQTLLIR